VKKLAIAFVGLNVLDIGLTLYFVGTGVSTELNPVMARVLALPLPAVIAYKTVLPAILVAGLLGISKHPAVRRFNVGRVLAIVVAVEAGVCLFNLTGLMM
jgi:hypothetical protein